MPTTSRKPRKSPVIKKFGYIIGVVLVCWLLSCQSNPKVIINDYFKITEFDCKDGSVMPVNVKNTIETDLKPALNFIRYYSQQIMVVNSGYRSPSYNAQIGGVPNSGHCFGYNADIKTFSSRQRYLFIKYAIVYNVTRIGIYPTWTDISVAKSGYPTEVIYLSNPDL